MLGIHHKLNRLFGGGKIKERGAGWVRFFIDRDLTATSTIFLLTVTDRYIHFNVVKGGRMGWHL